MTPGDRVKHIDATGSADVTCTVISIEGETARLEWAYLGQEGETEFPLEKLKLALGSMI
jgi:hypothetical protein